MGKQVVQYLFRKERISSVIIVLLPLSRTGERNFLLIQKERFILNNPLIFTKSVSASTHERITRQEQSLTNASLFQRVPVCGKVREKVMGRQGFPPVALPDRVSRQSKVGASRTGNRSSTEACVPVYEVEVLPEERVPVKAL
jgi:hypothetical protein